MPSLWPGRLASSRPVVGWRCQVRVRAAKGERQLLITKRALLLLRRATATYYFTSLQVEQVLEQLAAPARVEACVLFFARVLDLEVHHAPARLAQLLPQPDQRLQYRSRIGAANILCCLPTLIYDSPRPREGATSGQATEEAGPAPGADAEALTAVLDCAPERWDGFPFTRPGVGGATTQLVSDDGPECRRTALQSYLDDYKQCYEDHGCGERYPLFCEWKVSEWEVQCAAPRIGASTVEGEPPTMCKEHTVREIEVSTAAVRFRSPSFGCALCVAIGSERVTVAMRAGDSVVGWRARCVHLVLRVPAGGSLRQVRRNGLPPSLRLCSLHRLMLLRCAGATPRSSG